MTDYSWLKVYINQKIENVKNRRGYLINQNESFRDEGELEAYRDILRLIGKVEKT